MISLKQRRNNIDFFVRTDLNLLGCLTEDELFDGSSFMRAKKSRPSKSDIESAPKVMVFDAKDGGSLYAQRRRHKYLNPRGLRGFFEDTYKNVFGRRIHHGDKTVPTFEQWMGNEICWIQD